VPLVVRVVIGRSWGQGGQHSQGLHSFFMHIPGLRVVAPTSPHDAKGCLMQAIRENDPVIYLEHRMLHGLTGVVPAGEYTVPLGRARVVVPGEDLTIVAISHMVVESLRAHKHLAEVGISAEVIDAVSLSPIDFDTITASVQKTGRLLVVDTAWLACGAGSEIVAGVVERLQYVRELRVRRLGFAPVTCPTTRNLEDLFYPSAQDIASAVFALVKGGRAPWTAGGEPASEVVTFKGPF
jgi:pyruvate/2-oxoglutarate/acetoin dehydrogenase E1 component